MEANPAPPVLQRIDSRKLAPEHLERLKTSIAAWGGSSEAASNLGGEIAFILIGLLLLVPAVIGATKGYWGRTLVAGAIGLALIALGAAKLRRRFSNPVGTFTLATDTYLVISEGGALRVFSLAHVKGHTLTQQLRNGLYDGTFMELQFEDGTQVTVSERLAAADRAEPAQRSRLFREILLGADLAHAALRDGRWSSLPGAAMFPRPSSPG